MRRNRLRGVWGGLALLAASAVAAQGMPGGMGGMGGFGGGGPGGGREGGGVKAPVRAPQLDDLMPPDPWRLWAEELARLQATLGPETPQADALAGFVAELRDVQALNERRTLRAVRHAPLRLSPQPDPGRDLRDEQDEARDWDAALADLQARWATLWDAAEPPLREALRASYAQSLQLARQKAAP